MLQTTELCKSFKNQKAVNKVSLNIEKGTIYGLLGPNGAGKSTTLKMLTGMLKPTVGEIYFDGKPWDRRCLSEIGALIENPPIYENLSARDNLKVRSLLLGTDEKRIDDVLKMVSLTNTGKKKSGQFSMGMKQRLGIALCFAAQPQFLVLDEPLNGLDPDGIFLIRERMKEASEKGMAILISSHLLTELQKVASRFVFLHHGEVIGESGEESEEELENKYRSLFSEEERQVFHN